ncbi:hypothetical protein QJQ45_024431, partial [Haematococcus lacustris]
ERTASKSSDMNHSKAGWEWQGTQMLCDWDSGCLHQVAPHGTEPVAAEGSKRARTSWREKPRTFTSLYTEYKPRVEACWEGSLGIEACTVMADELYEAMATAPITDKRINTAGEKSRILTRALAVRDLLKLQDPTVQAAHEVRYANAGPAEDNKTGNKAVRLQRSSNEAEADATPDQCLMSVCLMLAAVFEQTPFIEIELKRKLYQDFTQLKRHFRKDELLVMHGNTSSVGELFASIKDIDKRSGLQNVIGILFEDWKVHHRVDPFIMADQLDVEVLALTCEGPIGKFACKLRTLVTLSTLHQRLQRELYHSRFANKAPPKTQLEPMTDSDPVDYIDFTECMARNMPFRHADRRSNLYYAWMYAPEVNASPEVWEKIFGPGNNACPSLFDGVSTPGHLIQASSMEGHDYVLDVEKAAEHDFAAEPAQAALAFPWADDLLGAWLRKLKEQRSQAAAKSGNTPSPSQQQQSMSSGSPSSSCRQAGTASPCSPLDLGTASSPPAHIKQQPPAQRPTPSHGEGTAHRASSAAPVATPSRTPTPTPEPSSAAGPPAAAPTGAPCASAPSSIKSDKAALAAAAAAGGFPARAASAVPVVPIPHAEKCGKLALPLGIFLVGLICSGGYTNTQIHVEDLLLMSINVNIFGAPKIWWWVPQESVQEFKEYAEHITEGGRGELYTKSISPFLTDREEYPPEQVMPLEKLRELGVKRTIQLPGMGIWTMPGYAFHFTVSMGFNIAESCNCFLEVMNWTFERLWRARPLEQYPEAEDDMARFMRETGVLATLEVPDRAPRHAAEVHRQLAPRILPGTASSEDGRGRLTRVVAQDLVKYAAMHVAPSPSPPACT